MRKALFLANVSGCSVRDISVVVASAKRAAPPLFSCSREAPCRKARTGKCGAVS